MKVKFNKPETRPESDDGIRVQYAPAKKSFPKLRWYLILLVVASPLLYFIGTVVADKILIRADGFVTLDVVDLSSSRSGTVTNIDVEYWDEVVAGQQVATVELPAAIVIPKVKPTSDNEKEEANLLRRQAENAAKQAQVLAATKEADIARTHIEGIQSRISVNRQFIKYSKERLAKLVLLQQQSAATAAEVNQAQLVVDKAKLTLLESRTNLQVEQIKLQSATGKLSIALNPLPPKPKPQLTLESESVGALTMPNNVPVNARGTGKVVEILVSENSFIRAGDAIVRVVENIDPIITSYVPPKYAKHTIVGQRVSVEFPNNKVISGFIQKLPLATKRLPIEFANAFGARPLSIVAQIKLDQPIQAQHAIHGLPVKITFITRFQKWLAVVKEKLNGLVD